MTRVWALADLHLSFGVPDKSMDVFGPAWERHAEQIAEHWLREIHPDDLVLLPGDISWAMRLNEVQADLDWIHKLPGTKVMIKGNHDYWWGSLKQVTSILPPSIHVIQNNSFRWKEIAVAGARLWDTPEYSFGQFIEFRENPRARDTEEAIQEDLGEKIFERELQRLEMSLKTLAPDAKTRIAMTHYPPISADLKPSRASALLEQYKVDICVFGHVHNIRGGLSLFGTHNGIRYVLAAADYTRFQPVALI